MGRFTSSYLLKMPSFITAALTVALLLAATAPPAASLSCPPCWQRWEQGLSDEQWCVKNGRPTPRNCRGGLSTGFCGCCKVCAKVENEKCMGLWGIHGKCDKGLHCVPHLRDMGKLYPSLNPRPGRCFRLWPKKEYELCGGMWNGWGDCAEGLTCELNDIISKDHPGHCIRVFRRN